MIYDFNLTLHFKKFAKAQVCRIEDEIIFVLKIISRARSLDELFSNPPWRIFSPRWLAESGNPTNLKRKAPFILTPECLKKSRKNAKTENWETLEAENWGRWERKISWIDCLTVFFKGLLIGFCSRVHCSRTLTVLEPILVEKNVYESLSMKEELFLSRFYLKAEYCI